MTQQSSQHHATPLAMRVNILGIGAWGPGFCSWPELVSLLRQEMTTADTSALDWTVANPKPAVIPPNERRRAPLTVKLPVETSWQALTESGLSAAEVCCVFSSGLGDTEITDYMCRELTTELKQLSPTKFHNSVHNAPAGYWTISTQCMKAANSISGYRYSAGLGLLESLSQCCIEQQPVLISLYDTACTPAFEELFGNDLSLSLSLIAVPHTATSSDAPYGTLEARVIAAPMPAPNTLPPNLPMQLSNNPAADALNLLRLLALPTSAQQRCTIALSDNSHLELTLEP